MIPVWKVKVLKMGEFTVDKSLETLGKDLGQTMQIPVLSIAVYSETTKILIDTGISDPMWVNKNIAPFFQTKHEQMINALKEGLDWSPENIDIVINTHLHHDHCGNNMLFQNAKFIIQKKEWEYAFNPLSIHKSIYYQKYFNHEAVNYFCWRLVDGEEEIVPGIKVLLTPGHTNGHQSVFINTAVGTLCAAGDVCNLIENITEMIPPSITTSAKKVLKSLEKIKSRAEYIIPGHDPIISNFQTDKFPKINSRSS